MKTGETRDHDSTASGVTVAIAIDAVNVTEGARYHLLIDWWSFCDWSAGFLVRIVGMIRSRSRESLSVVVWCHWFLPFESAHVFYLPLTLAYLRFLHGFTERVCSTAMRFTEHVCSNVSPSSRSTCSNVLLRHPTGPRRSSLTGLPRPPHTRVPPLRRPPWQVCAEMRHMHDPERFFLNVLRIAFLASLHSSSCGELFTVQTKNSHHNNHH